MALCSGLFISAPSARSVIATNIARIQIIDLPACRSYLTLHLKMRDTFLPRALL